jgi:hypothetical protein
MGHSEVGSDPAVPLISVILEHGRLVSMIMPLYYTGYELQIILYVSRAITPSVCKCWRINKRYYILFYSILFYSLLFYSIIFYSILFSSLLFYSILFYSILFLK